MILLKFYWSHEFGTSLYFESSNSKEGFVPSTYRDTHEIKSKKDLIHVLDDLFCAEIDPYHSKRIVVKKFIDFLKLEDDKNKYYSNFKKNIAWLCNNRTVWSHIRYWSNDLLILDNKSPFYLIEEPNDLKIDVLKYCLFNNIRFNKKTIGISKEGIEKITYQANLKKLKCKLERREKDLKNSKAKVTRAENSIILLKEKLNLLEKEYEQIYKIKK